MAKAKGRSKPPRKAAAKKPAKRPGENQPPTESDSSFLPVVKAFANDRQVVCDKGWGAGNERQNW